MFPRADDFVAVEVDVVSVSDLGVAVRVDGDRRWIGALALDALPPAPGRCVLRVLRSEIERLGLAPRR